MSWNKTAEFVKTTPLGKPLLWLKGKLFSLWDVPAEPAVKRQIILDYAGRYGLKILVETGTYQGDTVEVCKAEFDELYSVELDPVLFKKAELRFAGQNKIHILQGDSGQVMPEIIGHLSKPTLFWLDGHYSGGETAKGQKNTPIVEELESIFKGFSWPFVILIDDARCFNGRNDYLSFGQLKKLVNNYNKNFSITKSQDIIRIAPSK